DELLGGEVTPDYRIGRRHGLGNAPAGSILPLLDDAEAGMRAYLVSLPRSATVEAPLAPKGAGLGGVGNGLLPVLLSSGPPLLRRRRTAPRLPPRDRRLAQHGRGRRAVPVGPAGLSGPPRGPAARPVRPVAVSSCVRARSRTRPRSATPDD